MLICLVGGGKAGLKLQMMFSRDKKKEEGRNKWRNRYWKETYQNQKNAYLQEI